MLQEQRNEIRKSLTELKLHIDHIDNLTRNSINMIYAIEDNMMDLEDIEYAFKYGKIEAI